MQIQWRLLKEKFDQLSTRERYIMIALLLSVIFFIWDQLLYSPLNRKLTIAVGQVETIQAQITANQNEFATLAQTLKDDPNTELRGRIKAVEHNVKKLNQRIEQLTADLIPPEQMPVVLEKMLTQNRGLKLIRVKSLPVEKISLSENNAKIKVSTETDGEYLYQYGVELELEGPFFQVLAYLKDLEKLPWRLVWNQLEYEVQQYPVAVVRLRINTLSTDSGWIGV